MLQEQGEEFNIRDCPLYPSILSEFKKLGIEMNSFGLAIMHLIFLSIAKALIDELPRIFAKDNKVENAAFQDLVEHLDRCHERIAGVSLDWCNTMKFSGKDGKIGTAKWVSKNCVGFVRMSLYSFNYLDVLLERDGISDETKKGLKAYRKMIVMFYLLVSYIFDEEYKSSCVRDEKVDHYVRIFLSSCRQFDHITRAKRLEGNQKDAQKSFFLSKGNFLSLLGLSGTIMRFGPVSGMYEGTNEGFVRQLKREMSVVMHNDEFLTRILTKTARSQFLEKMVDGNRFSSGNSYTRLNSIPVYEQMKPNLLIEECSPFGGMIDRESKLWLCYKGKHSAIETRPLIIDDTNGRSICNLWYSVVSVDMDDSKKMIYSNRKDFLLACHDFFIAAGIQVKDGEETTNLYEIKYRGWKLRRKGGDRGHLIPEKDILLMN